MARAADPPLLPHVDKLDTLLVSEIRARSHLTNGLAVIIGCPNSCKKTQQHLSGAVQDVIRGRDVFQNQLMFVPLCLLDPTVKHIRTLIKIISQLNTNAVMLPERWRRIVVVFSGHGDEGDVLYTRDGCVSLRNDLVEPLLAKNAPKLALIPKLFFIDACRGGVEDQGVVISWCETPVARGGQTIPSNGSYLIACSTMPGMKSFEVGEGGLWMQLLMNELVNPDNEDVSILEIMRRVNKRLITVCNQYKLPIQGPLMESALADDIKLLKEAKMLQLEFQQQELQMSLQQSGYQLQQQQCSQEHWSHQASQLQGTAPLSHLPQSPIPPHPYQMVNPVSPLPLQLPVWLNRQDQTGQFRGPQEAAGSRDEAAKPKGKKMWKTKLEEYFNAKGQDGKKVVEYRTKAEGYGCKSTVICPEVGYVTGEKKPTKPEAEHSAAKMALKKLKLV